MQSTPAVFFNLSSLKEVKEKRKIYRPMPVVVVAVEKSASKDDFKDKNIVVEYQFC